MDRESAIVILKDLREVVEKHTVPHEAEIAISEADDVIFDLLRSLGCQDVVDEYDKIVRAWHA